VRWRGGPSLLSPVVKSLLDIQRFFTDHELIRAINDLSIAVKLELAGVRDVERVHRAEKARQTLRGFLARLGEIQAEGEREVVTGIDARSQSLTTALLSAREDSARFSSVLMREGAEGATRLLDATERPAKQKLLDSLAELRRVVEQHQQADASVIFEEQ
jgi:ribosomal protein L31E